MRKFIQQKLKNQKGLTLIELLAVIVILAIIAAIAIPAIGNIINNSRVGAAKSDVLNAMSAAELYMADNPDATTVTLTEISSASGNTYLDDQGTLSTFVFDPATKEVYAVANPTNYDVTFGSSTDKVTKAGVSSLPNNTRASFTVTTANGGGTIKVEEATTTTP